MGFVYSCCFEKKTYFVAILGADQKLKKELFTRITGFEFASGSAKRYDEKKVQLNGLNMIICYLDDDRITLDLWPVHVNCANACLFVCNPEIEDRDLIEKTFETQFSKKLEKKNFGVLALVRTSERFNKPILEGYSNMKNVHILRIDDSCKNRANVLDKGIDWVIDVMQS